MAKEILFNIDARDQLKKGSRCFGKCSKSNSGPERT